MENNIKNKRFLILSFVLGALSASRVILAAELGVDWPASPFGTRLTATSELPNFIQYLYEWGISIGGFLVFVSLVIAGFQYLSSAGNPSVMRDARDRILSAFLGLGLLLGSWLILNTINPQFTKLQLPPFNPGSFEMEEPQIPSAEQISGEGSETCTKAEIRITGGETITLDQDTACSSDYVGELEIGTNDNFGVVGFVGDEQKICNGNVTVFQDSECGSPVESFGLKYEWKNETVGQTVIAARFEKIEF